MPGAKRGTVRWPLNQWPELDRTTWIRHCAPGDPFDDPRYGATLRAPTLRFISDGYGCWLCFLAARGWLDPLQPPLQRVTRGRLRAYFQALRAAGYADYTIIARFSGLTAALKILAPGQDVSWIQRPDGVTIAALLPKTKRSLMVPDSGVLFQWAVDMMDAAASPRDYRDGLLLALLAARGRRLRSMALLRPGQELIWRGERYRIELTPKQVKTGKPDRFDLPAQLTPYIRHYLTVVRPALLGGRVHDALWINLRGEPWSPACMAQRIRLLSRQRFGESFGPHRFRHAIATSATLRDPDHPGLAVGVLGISGHVLEEHYNRAGQSQAVTMFDKAVARRRTKLRRAAAQTLEADRETHQQETDNEPEIG
jgi:site-specific recombinase XerD